jgi:hypothetical protein
MRFRSLAGASSAAHLAGIFRLNSSSSRDCGMISSNSSSSFGSSAAFRLSLEPKEPSGATEPEAKPEIASRRLPEGGAQRSK